MKTRTVALASNPPNRYDFEILRECEDCGALIVNTTRHAEWHERWERKEILDLLARELSDLIYLRDTEGF